MMLPIEEIQNDVDFQHACTTYGLEVSRILNYMAKQMKDKAFKKGTSDHDRNKLAKKVENIEEFITTIINQSQPNSPEFLL
ncbi:hypothetical protein K4M64_004542 [Salmonella enterica]|nr:hypothetical protein [Salmonella enterica]